LETVKKNHVDSIVHFARVNFHMPTVEKVVIAATTSILELARIVGLKRVLIAGTGMEFGTRLDLRPLSEDDPLNPMQEYGIAKCAAEMIGWNYANNHGVDFVSIRFSSVYGPLERVPGLQPGTGMFRPAGVAQLLRAALDGKSFEMEKGGDYPRDYTYVADAAEGAYLASTITPLKHRLYHIGSGRSYSLRELAEEIMQLIPGATIKIGPGMLDDVPSIKTSIRGPLNTDRARTELGFQPKYTLCQGLQEHIEWLKKHPY
jgi:UDP-glucose 4-epimerase